MPCAWYCLLTVESNLAATLKPTFATGCITRTAFSPLVHRSWAEPAGAFNTSSLPLSEKLPSPTGLTNVHNPVFKLALLKLSGCGAPPAAERLETQTLIIRAAKTIRANDDGTWIKMTIDQGLVFELLSHF